MARYCIWITVEGTPRFSLWQDFPDDGHARLAGEVLVDRFNRDARSAAGKALSHTVAIESEDGQAVAEFGSFPLVRTAA